MEEYVSPFDLQRVLIPDSQASLWLGWWKFQWLCGMKDLKRVSVVKGRVNLQSNPLSQDIDTRCVTAQKLVASCHLRKVFWSATNTAFQLGRLGPPGPSPQADRRQPRTGKSIEERGSCATRVCEESSKQTDTLIKSTSSSRLRDGFWTRQRREAGICTRRWSRNEAWS